MRDGVEDTASKVAKDWINALENYTFKEVDGASELLVDMDSADKFVDIFKEVWPQALQKLKELAEK